MLAEVYQPGAARALRRTHVRIDSRFQMRDGDVTGYRVVDVVTGEEMQSYEHGAFRNWQGYRIEVERTSQMVVPAIKR